MINNNNDNKQENLDILDIITMLSFMAQIQNIKEDKAQNIWINKIIETLFQEINKLHYENELLFKKLEEVENAINK